MTCDTCKCYPCLRSQCTRVPMLAEDAARKASREARWHIKG